MISLFKNRRVQIIIVTVLLFIVTLLSIDRFSKVNLIRNIFTVPVSFVQGIVKGAEDSITEFINSIKDYQYVIEENEYLHQQIAILNEQNAGLADLKEENKRLKSALLLKERFLSFQLIGANVLSTNPSNYKYELIIDAGTSDGVKTDNPVIASNNALIGKIWRANINTSTVTPIMDEYSGISGWIISGEGGHVTIRGSLELKEYGLCMVENIPKEIEVSIGDVVETSGLGGIYPKGIIVGTIVEIFNEDSPSKRYAYLEPLVQIKSIKEVFLLTVKDVK